MVKYDLARADLHLHTTCSDGTYTPEEIVSIAKRSGLAAIAITDHDTIDGIELARKAIAKQTDAKKNGLELVPAIELTAQWRESELHLLGYFIDPKDDDLRRALGRLTTQRQERFVELVRRLGSVGVSLSDGDVAPYLRTPNPNRRQLAELLVARGFVDSVREAFHKFLRDNGPLGMVECGLPVEEAVAVIRGAGGVAVWAHPAYDCRRKNLVRLCAMGLQGIEVEYPGYRGNRVQQMRELARDFNLVISGGSDCHGPWPYHQTVGARGITMSELEQIRQTSK